MTLNLATNTYLEWLEQEEQERQAQVQTYRAYYDGDFPTALTDRQASFLNMESDKGFGANICGVVVDTPVERLDVTGFSVYALDPSRTPHQETALMMGRWWALNRMDARQDWVYRAALRDREAFIIIGYDNERQFPTFDHDYAYDGKSGVKVTMKPGTYREMAFASKRWVVDVKTKRLNLYFPDRIEKWINRDAEKQFSEAMWVPLPPDMDEEVESVVLIDDRGREYQASVVWWTDNGEQTGNPLGVPVVPFINRDDGTARGLSEIDNALPFQDAVNKVFIDLMAAADMTGWQMFWTNGQLPSNLNVYPGAMIPVAPAEGATEGETPIVGVLPPADLTNLTNLMNSLIALLSGVTATPQSRFVPSAVRPSEGTQKMEESALIAKIKGLQKVWGNAWEDVMKMAWRVAKAFGTVEIEADLPDLDNVDISTNWADIEIRNELTHLASLSTKKNELDIPRKQVWSEAGYSEAKVKEMESMKEAEREMAMEEASVMQQGQTADALSGIGRILGGSNGKRVIQEQPQRQPSIF